MLTLYHAPISPNSRRVWITLLEKNVEFELVEVNLDGDQFKPEFVAMNPFHHIPVLSDDNFNVVESLAILDYIEAKYPTPALLPTDPQTLAKVRMVQMVSINELLPAAFPLFPQMLGLPGADPETVNLAHQKIATALTFFESLLADSPYFGGQKISLAEVVAGTIIPWLPRGGVSLSDYPKLSEWCESLMERSSWQETEARPKDITAMKSRMAKMIAKPAES